MGIRLLVAVVLAGHAVAPLTVAAQPSPYVTVRLSRGVLLQLPRNCRVLSRTSWSAWRRVSWLGPQGQAKADFSSDFTFAANYYDDEPKGAALVNLRHYPEQTVSQLDVRGFSPADLQTADEPEHSNRPVARSNESETAFVARDQPTDDQRDHGDGRGVSRHFIGRRLPRSPCARNDAARSFPLTVSYREDHFSSRPRAT